MSLFKRIAYAASVGVLLAGLGLSHPALAENKKAVLS